MLQRFYFLWFTLPSWPAYGAGIAGLLEGSKLLERSRTTEYDTTLKLLQPLSQQGPERNPKPIFVLVSKGTRSLLCRSCKATLSPSLCRQVFKAVVNGWGEKGSWGGGGGSSSLLHQLGQMCNKSLLRPSLHPRPQLHWRLRLRPHLNRQRFVGKELP